MVRRPSLSHRFNIIAATQAWVAGSAAVRHPCFINTNQRNCGHCRAQERTGISFRRAHRTPYQVLSHCPFAAKEQFATIRTCIKIFALKKGTLFCPAGLKNGTGTRISVVLIDRENAAVFGRMQILKSRCDLRFPDRCVGNRFSWSGQKGKFLLSKDGSLT